MPCDFCVLRARSLVIYHLLVLQVYSILNLVIFIFLPRPAGIKEFKKADSQTKDQKTLKTRPKRPSFRNGLGTVPGVYEATTIAHRTPPALAVTMVGGTFGVLETFFGQKSRLPPLMYTMVYGPRPRGPCVCAPADR